MAVKDMIDKSRSNDPSRVRGYQGFGLYPPYAHHEHDCIMSYYNCSSVCNEDITTTMMEVVDNTGKVLRKSAKVLLDSGCSRTLMSIKFFEELQQLGTFRKEFNLDKPFKYMCTNQEVEVVTKAVELNLRLEGIEVYITGGLNVIPFDIIMSWTDIKKNNLVPVFYRIWREGLVRRTTVLGTEDEGIENEFAYATKVEIEGLGEEKVKERKDVKSSKEEDLKKALEGCLCESKIISLLGKYKEVFSSDLSGPGAYVEPMRLVLNDTQLPRWAGPRKIPIDHLQFVKETLTTWETSGIIRKVKNSKVASAIHLVAAPGKDPRLTIDFRGINDCLVSDIYPLPYLSAIVDSIRL